MTGTQALIIAILSATMFSFIWGRWRHDMVAVGSLLACVLTGLVDSANAFAGFGHPAVITVACVLILSSGLQVTGAVDALAQRVLPKTAGPMLAIAALTGLAALLSGFMNNVGAMALLMPVAIQTAQKLGLAPGKVLMPLAFGSILGGTITLIGTPPNLIVSGFRAEVSGSGFSMFDFSPVGLAVAGVGILFITLIGWRLVPSRKQADSASFETGSYLTEARVTKDSKFIGKSLKEVENFLLEDDVAQIVGLVRNEFRITTPHPNRKLHEGDLLVIETEPESLAAVLSGLGLKLEEAVPLEPTGEKSSKDEALPASVSEKETGISNMEPEHEVPLQPDEKIAPSLASEPQQEPEKAKGPDSDITVLMEFVVMPGSRTIGRSARLLHLRTRHGLNLLAFSRQGRRSIKRLRSTPLQAGDVLLLQGTAEALSEFAAQYGCVPLAQRSIRIPDRQKAVLAAGIMAVAVGMAALGILPVAISFAAGVLLFMAFKVVSLRKVYDAVDWPVIVLLGAMLPVAGAMAHTGAADLIARFLLGTVAQGNPVIGLAVILVCTMLMTDFMNNAATAAVMCPVAISTASQLGANPDSFLMAVAIGSSCAFLTPIGHQNNTLILGPGGFGFGDYWRMGLPTDLIVIAVSVPMLLWVWPL
jgi:di/tricarboxylate transporter